MALLLWDHIITERADEINGMTRAELGDLSTSALEGTVDLFAVPFEQYFPDGLAAVLTSAVHRCRISAPEWRLDRCYFTHFADAVEAGLTAPLQPGCGPFTMATLTLVNGITGDLDSDDAMAVLSSCYTAIAFSQLPGLVTNEGERRNQRCRRAIALQQDLISRFSAPR
ncbi:hypothetical protein [Nocardia brasiliensis]|uniref:hypothetical protein n=1 Tax=Nocardia brasiliensis TaxID=37326 RepID=UPI002454023D|nr:hypothetical protein [Nocardia brasiliensis]